MTPTKIMIVTGEASGDLHGANLLRALQAQLPDLVVCGMGGQELASLGMDILFDAAKVSVVGIVEVFPHLPDVFKAQRLLRRRLQTDRPDLLILIDLPDFNLMLAKKAKSLGIPVFYYISPQVWGWRSGRVKTIKKRVEKLGVIFPFEADFFRERGVDAEYVGNPLLDSVRILEDRRAFLARHGLTAETTSIGLLPGSRKREIASLLPVFLGAARLMQEQFHTRLAFFLPQASTITDRDLEEAGLADFQRDLDIRIVKDDRYSMMAACDAVMAASGTVTLELAILQVPMVVCYKLSPLTYRLAKMMVKLDHFSLANLIAGYTAVPELLQDEVTPENIADELMALLTIPEKMHTMKTALQGIKHKLGEAGASEKAAAVAIRLLQKHHDDRKQ
ncbi:MAG: lipid-A-disaccharide synthase [Desulfobacterales bacterium GWB2_56_26]|nr:MAG: lipid-A-disaccharide synthase [Desulfobacterales bacterium GWB2_56_26]